MNELDRFLEILELFHPHPLSLCMDVSNAQGYVLPECISYMNSKAVFDSGKTAEIFRHENFLDHNQWDEFKTDLEAVYASLNRNTTATRQELRAEISKMLEPFELTIEEFFSKKFSDYDNEILRQLYLMYANTGLEDE